MEIVKIKNDPSLNEKSRILGNCYSVQHEGTSYNYEFTLNGKYAKIICNSPTFLEEVTRKHHIDHKWITEYRNDTFDFYMSFEDIHTFKLPISILQVSKIFLSQERLKQISDYEEIVDYPLPVAIIEDEYVLLKGHHQLSLAKELGNKMVDVYLDEPIPSIYDYLYLAKEQNIKTVEDMKRISEEEYLSIQQQLDFLFTLNK